MWSDSGLMSWDVKSRSGILFLSTPSFRTQLTRTYTLCYLLPSLFNSNTYVWARCHDTEFHTSVRGCRSDDEMSKWCFPCPADLALEIARWYGRWHDQRRRHYYLFEADAIQAQIKFWVWVRDSTSRTWGTRGFRTAHTFQAMEVKTIYCKISKIGIVHGLNAQHMTVEEQQRARTVIGEAVS